MTRGMPVVAGVEISTDERGRFNLNALHIASGLGDHKRPSKWLASEPTQELIRELESQSPSAGFGPVRTVRGGNAPGTFAHELLAISYAGWISPSFQLKVNQVFLDYRAGHLQVPQTLPEALLLAAELAEENERMKTTVTAFDRIAGSEGSMCVTDAAKDLQMRPRDLFRWLQAHRWIYRRPGGQGWVAYQDRIQAGHLVHKVTTVERGDGTERVVEQVRVTPRGVSLLALRTRTALAG